MRRDLTDPELDAHIFAARRYAWRWEQQPVYFIGHEQAKVDAFLAGRPESPLDNKDMAAFYSAVTTLTHTHGVAVGRVRVVDEPATDYQRWLEWMDQFNRQAGEVIHHLPRPLLRQMGRPPFEPDADWWLIDGEKILLMHYAPDGSGRRVPPGTRTKVELIEGGPEVRLARLWRLAVVSWAIEAERETTTEAAAAAA